jgi:hypothetical protein
VPVTVLKGERPVDTFPLSDSLSGRDQAAKLILGHLGPSDPARAAVQNALGELLTYAADRLSNRPEEAGPPLRDLVFDQVKDQFKIRFRTEGGLWSETLGEVRRADFITHVPEWLVVAAGQCRGVPRDAQGEPLRHEVARQVQSELGILYATLRESMPLAPDADTDHTTVAANQFREAVVLLWTKICTAEHLKLPDAEDATRRASLIRRVKTAAAPYLDPNGHDPTGLGWQRAHPSFSAWWRPVVDPETGEVRVYLAMRSDLAGQVGVPLPGVTNGHTLARLARKYGVKDGNPSVTPSLAGGQARLTVLSRELTDYLLGEPQDAVEGCDTDGPEFDGATGVTV